MVSMMLRNCVMNTLDAVDAVERFEARVFGLAAEQGVALTAEDVAGLEDLAERYVRETLRLLEACVTAADQARARDMFAPVLSVCERFFLQTDPRIPDQGGLFGLICDCYLARSLLSQVSERMRLIRGFPMLATNPHSEAGIIESLVGRDVTTLLDEIVHGVAATPAIRFAPNGAYQLIGPMRATGRVSEWEARWEDLVADYSRATGMAFTTAA